MPILKVIRECNVAIADCGVGPSQIRTLNVPSGIEDLAENIRVVGLLEPIIVCEAEPGGPWKYEILAGQRRYQAVKHLGHEEIAARLVERPNTDEASIISLCENDQRLDPNKVDFIEAFTLLFERYGTIKAVSEKSGIPYNRCRDMVQFERLIPELQDLVRSKKVTQKTALRAQDAASSGRDNEVNSKEAIKLANEMSGQSGVEQERLKKVRERNPDKSVEEVIEEAKTSESVKQIVVTLTESVQDSLKTYASDQGLNQDDAAGNLIEGGLREVGLIS